jgi:hypothetical protein
MKTKFIAPKLLAIVLLNAVMYSCTSNEDDFPYPQQKTVQSDQLKMQADPAVPQPIIVQNEDAPGEPLIPKPKG